jgi:hypothetical protein
MGAISARTPVHLETQVGRGFRRRLDPGGCVISDREGIDGVRVAQSLIDLFGVEETAGLHPISTGEFQMGLAQGHELPTREPSHHLGRGRRRSPLPETELTDEAQTLRVAELGAITVLVLDHATPKGNAPQYRWGLGFPEEVGVVRSVQATRTVDVRGGVEPGSLARGFGNLQWFPRTRPAGDRAEQHADAVAVSAQGPGAPGDHRFVFMFDGEAMREPEFGGGHPERSGDVGSCTGDAGSEIGACSGSEGAGAVCGSGRGSGPGTGSVIGWISMMR